MDADLFDLVTVVLRLGLRRASVGVTVAFCRVVLRAPRAAANCGSYPQKDGAA